MGQMAITGLKWCDFIVFCKNDWNIETIFFDEEFFADMYNKLSLFFITTFSLPYKWQAPFVKQCIK